MSQINKTSRRWEFVWNNYSEDNLLQLEKIDQSKVDFIIYGFEGQDEGKTPHLQGYLELNTPIRGSGVKKLLDPILGTKSEVHVAIAKASRERNVIYCSKGQQSKEDWDCRKEHSPAYGIDAKVVQHEYHVKQQGKRTDWDKLYEAIRDEPDYPTILQKYPEYAIKYSTGIKTAIEAIHISNGIAQANAEIEGIILRKWQDNLVEELKEKPDKEKIIWYVDIIGGCGKSTLCDKVLATFKDSMLFENGKTADIAHSWNGQQICLFDFSRSNESHINYGVIESLKNGRIYSGKYNGGLKRFGRPHVVCFSNFHPDKSKFSEYKWDIRELSADDKLPFVDETEIIDENQCDTLDDNKLTDAYNLTKDCGAQPAHGGDFPERQISSRPEAIINDNEHDMSSSRTKISSMICTDQQLSSGDNSSTGNTSTTFETVELDDNIDTSDTHSEDTKKAILEIEISQIREKYEILKVNVIKSNIRNIWKQNDIRTLDKQMKEEISKLMESKI